MDYSKFDNLDEYDTSSDEDTVRISKSPAKPAESTRPVSPKSAPLPTPPAPIGVQYEKHAPKPPNPTPNQTSVNNYAEFKAAQEKLAQMRAQFAAQQQQVNRTAGAKRAAGMPATEEEEEESEEESEEEEEEEEESEYEEDSDDENPAPQYIPRVPMHAPSSPPATVPPVVVRDAAYWKADGGEKYKTKDYKGAVESYGKAIELDPQTAVYYTNRSAAHMMLLAYKEACADADSAIALDSSNARAYFRKATALKGLGNLDAAIDTYRRGLELDSSSAADSARKELAQLERARAKLEGIRDLIRQKRFAPALSHLNTILGEIGSTFRVLLYLKLDCLIELRKFEEAINLSNSMIKSSSQGSGDLELMQLRSKCLYNMGDLENAVKHLQMCIRADPENAAIIKTFKFYRKVEEKRLAGNAAFKAQNWQEAITEWNACIELDPRNVGVITKLYYNRGVAYAKVSRFDDSIMDCTRAIRLDNNYAKAYVRRGDSHMSFPGDGPHIEQAIADFEKAGEIYSNATGDEDDEKSNKAELKAVKTKIQQAKVALKRSKRKDLYALMGVAQTATEEEIKKAYKKKALIYHPDRNHSKTDAQKAENEKIFKEINSAYEILTDPQKKALYDQGVEEEDMESAMQQRYGSQNDHDDEPGCGRRGHSRGGGHGFGGFGGGGFGGGGFGGDPNDMFREYMRQQQR